jgi:hypothetical protein
MSPAPAPTARAPAEPTSVLAGVLDNTVRLATSWVGLFTAYIAALTVGLTNYKGLTGGLEQAHLPPWSGLVLISVFPLGALVFSTIPSLIERRRAKRYAEIRVDPEAGYFTLRPRDAAKTFERADQAHVKVLRWIKETSEPILYFSGASGTGKTSLLTAWVIPQLQNEHNVVIQLRGYEQVLERIREGVLTAELGTRRPPARDTNL